MVAEREKLVPQPPMTCTSMWIGGHLGPVSAACLASFVRHGHRVVLYCYDAPKDVPPGVDLADAGTVVEPGRVISHKKTGSHALFSDLFRYELQRQNLGTWIDCDVYCVRRFDTDTDYIFGWQNKAEINGAVLKLPSQSPLVDRLIGLFTQTSPILPWLSEDDQRKLRERKLSGDKFSLSDLPWGSAGPRALTYLVRELGLVRHALPPTVFYPLPAREAPQLLRADSDIVRFLTPATHAIHLWNEALRHHLSKAQRKSPIHRLQSTGMLFDEALLRDRAERIGESGRQS
jgi:hypothetical protein